MEQPNCQHPNHVMLINESAKMFHDRMRSESVKNGMRSAYRPLLRPISEQEGITQQELAERTHLKAPTVSVTLQQMEQEGLVIRQTDGKDQRLIRVSLTPQGRALHQRMMGSIRRLEETMLAGVGQEELDAAYSALLAIRQNLYRMEGRKG